MGLSQASFLLDKDAILVKVRNMAKVTSKLQVTIPKALAERFGVHPGDEIEWSAAGESIRIVPCRAIDGRSLAASAYSVEDRLRFFDQATQRQHAREQGLVATTLGEERGWTRDDLYDRAHPR